MSFDKFYKYIYSQAETLDEYKKNKKKTQSRQTNQHQRQSVNGIQYLIPPQKWSSMTKEAKIAHCKKHNIFSKALNPQGKFLPDGKTPRRKKGNGNGNGNGAGTGTSQRQANAHDRNQAGNGHGTNTPTGNETHIPSKSESQQGANIQSSPPVNQPSHGHVMRTFMSNGNSQQAANQIVLNGVTYRTMNMEVRYQNTQYRIANAKSSRSDCALVDRGANGGFWGSEGRVIATSDTQKADISGIQNTVVRDLPISTIAAKLQSDQGPIIGLFHQYALCGEGNTIHSSIQFEAFGHEVHNKGLLLGGKQHIKTVDGFVIPMSMVNGLVYMHMDTPTDEEMESLTHVTMTSDVPWDPTKYDCEHDLMQDLPELTLRDDNSDVDSLSTGESSQDDELLDDV